MKKRKWIRILLAFAVLAALTGALTVHALAHDVYINGMCASEFWATGPCTLNVTTGMADGFGYVHFTPGESGSYTFRSHSEHPKEESLRLLLYWGDSNQCDALFDGGDNNFSLTADLEQDKTYLLAIIALNVDATTVPFEITQGVPQGGFVLSGGNLALLAGMACLAVAVITVLLIVKKKKSAAAYATAT